VARISEELLREIIEMIEDELHSVHGLNRIEKMKIRTKIRHQSKWLMAFVNPTPKIVMDKMKKKMPDVFSVLPYGFSDDFKEFLEGKMRNLGKKR